jgi:hypothetical protein
VGGPSPQHPPEALNDLELGTIAGQPVELQMGERFEGLGDQGSPMPGSIVDHEHHTGIVRRGIRVAGKIVLFYTLRAQLLSRDRYLEPFS